MKKIATIAAALLLIAGCSAGSEESEPTEAPVEEQAAPTAPATGVAEEPSEPEPSEEAADESDDYGESVVTDHGLLLKNIGQQAGITSWDGEDTLMQFVLTEAVTDFECTSGYAEEPTNGHYLGLRFEIETFPELANEQPPDIFMSMHDFVAWDDEGNRVNDPSTTGTCIDNRDAVPVPLGPGETVSGWIVLDVPTLSGSVGYAPTGLQDGGWEWAYGD